MKNRIVISMLFLLALVVQSENECMAELMLDVKVVVSREASSYRYSYTVENTAASSSGFSAFAINVGDISLVAEELTPAGWLYQTQQDGISVAWDGSAASLQFLPGEFATFEVLSTLGPAEETFSGLGVNLSSFSLEFATGMTTTPSGEVVPEPKTSLLLAIAIVILVVCVGVRTSSFTGR